jgi:hypothetical protein
MFRILLRVMALGFHIQNDLLIPIIEYVQYA